MDVSAYSFGMSFTASGLTERIVMEGKKNTYLLEVNEEHVKLLAQLALDELSRENLFHAAVTKSIATVGNVIIVIAVLRLLGYGV
jgi:hypothetical protein